MLKDLEVSILEAIYYIVISLIGLVAGILGSMFGLGGGFLIVPLLSLLGVDIKIAIGTSATAIFFNSLSATISYSRSRLVIFRAGIFISLVAIFSAYLGASLTRVVETTTLKLIFGSVLILLALRMILEEIRRDTRRSVKESDFKWSLGSYMKLLFGGFLSGLVAGLLGVGGGVINVPLLTYIGFTIHQAVATSSMAITITTLSSAATHYTLGHLDHLLMILLTPTLVIGAQIGASIAKRTRPRRLRIGFSLVLIAIATRLVLEALHIL